MARLLSTPSCQRSPTCGSRRRKHRKGKADYYEGVCCRRLFLDARRPNHLRQPGWQSYAVNQDGSGRTLLTPDDRFNSDPSVCGDGRYIVYAAYREQKQGIWRMSADGSNPIRIADETFAVGPQCSPDGKWVVYLRGPSWTPVKVPITGAKPPEVLAQDFGFEIGFGYPLRISPDGKRIMYLASPEPLRTPVLPPHPIHIN